MTAPVFTHIRISVELGTDSGGTFSLAANAHLQKSHILAASVAGPDLSDHRVREIGHLVQRLYADAVVGNSSNAPAVTNPGAQSATHNVAITPLAITATDADGDTLSYTAAGLPTGLTINSSTGSISGTPTTAGTYSSSVTVSDGGKSTKVAFVWTVA